MDQRTFVTEVSRSLHDPGWDDFLARCHGGHHEQTSLWAQVKAHYNWSPVRYVFFENGKICGGFQILWRSFKYLGKVGYISRGPTVEFEDSSLKRWMALQLVHAAKKERLFYLSVVPGYPDQDFAAQLRAVGFKPKPNWLPPTGLIQATFLMDLRDDLSLILSRMRRSTRKHIRSGLKGGVVVREARDEKDVDTFRRLFEGHCRRKGVIPTPPQPEFFHLLWRIFAPHGFIKIFLAEFNGVAIVGLLAFSFGDTVRIWKIGWDGSMPKHYPNELLHWRMMEWAKEEGFQNFDFVGADGKWAEAALRGNPCPEETEFGETWFKAGFGGRAVLVQGAFCKFSNPLVSAIIMNFGNHLSSSSIARRFSGV